MASRPWSGACDPVSSSCRNLTATSFLQDYGYYDEAAESYNIRTQVQTSLNAVLLVGAILASLSAGPIGSKYGRRAGLIWMGVVAIIGVILQISIPHVGGLLTGRFFAGGKGFPCSCSSLSTDIFE